MWLLCWASGRDRKFRPHGPDSPYNRSPGHTRNAFHNDKSIPNTCRNPPHAHRHPLPGGHSDVRDGLVGIQDGISDSQADYFRRTIAELNDLTEDRIFVTRPIPAASSLDLNAYQGLDFAIVSPRVFALLERYNGFIPMASLSVDIPDCEPGAELRPVVSALVFATTEASATSPARE